MVQLLLLLSSSFMNVALIGYITIVGTVVVRPVDTLSLVLFLVVGVIVVSVAAITIALIIDNCHDVQL